MIRLKTASENRVRPKGHARFGLGTAIQKTIHATIDSAPISVSLKKKIKNCPSCGRRARWLDRAVPNVNPFAKNLPPEENSIKPIE